MSGCRSGQRLAQGSEHGKITSPVNRPSYDYLDVSHRNYGFFAGRCCSNTPNAIPTIYGRPTFNSECSHVLCIRRIGLQAHTHALRIAKDTEDFLCSIMTDPERRGASLASSVSQSSSEFSLVRSYLRGPGSRGSAIRWPRISLVCSKAQPVPRLQGGEGRVRLRALLHAPSRGSAH
ncbi:hypothetical protein BV22DRAFT_861996 [Leucogyrophana mollusca]|uniref:Uncharacterized protein n=1 Tax=Leucogyrophana mollusca TaxID=85980 RepID=A0ACB8B1I9_9AGAM|nr:hypothetical protein BV22DRAFT_861996 [Leucogyrophana mollusca]